MVCLFRESYKKYYYASWISFPSCITIVAVIIMVLLPFFAAFSNQRFWSLIDVFYEHPVIRYNNEYMLELNTLTDKVLTGSSFPSINKAMSMSPAKVMIVEIFKNDTNHDDIIDSIQFRMLILLGNAKQVSNEQVSNVRLMLFMEYIIQTKAKMKMQTLCYLNINTPNGASQIITNGELVLHQKTPMKVLPYIDESMNYDYFGSESPNRDVLPSMAEAYEEFTANRDFTTRYDYNARVKPFYSDDSLEIIVNIDIPTNQKIIYEMSTAESLKFNWIQYLALFIPASIIVFSFLSFIFKYHLFPCAVMSDIPKVIN